jgi:hypothetical protein
METGCKVAGNVLIKINHLPCKLMNMPPRGNPSVILLLLHFHRRRMSRFSLSQMSVKLPPLPTRFEIQCRINIIGFHDRRTSLQNCAIPSYSPNLMSFRGRYRNKSKAASNRLACHPYCMCIFAKVQNINYIMINILLFERYFNTVPFLIILH